MFLIIKKSSLLKSIPNEFFTYSHLGDIGEVVRREDGRGEKQFVKTVKKALTKQSFTGFCRQGCGLNFIIKIQKKFLAQAQVDCRCSKRYFLAKLFKKLQGIKIK